MDEEEEKIRRKREKKQSEFKKTLKKTLKETEIKEKKFENKKKTLKKTKIKIKNFELKELPEDLKNKTRMRARTGSRKKIQTETKII